jgi:hypothetical protein
VAWVTIDLNELNIAVGVAWNMPDSAHWPVSVIKRDASQRTGPVLERFSVLVDGDLDYDVHAHFAGRPGRLDIEFPLGEVRELVRAITKEATQSSRQLGPAEPLTIDFDGSEIILRCCCRTWRLSGKPIIHAGAGRQRVQGFHKSKTQLHHPGWELDQ